MKTAFTASRGAGARATALATLLLAISPSASASFLSGDALDAMAGVLAWVVILFVPIGAIVLFWLVHVMPEKIAEKNHHPQQQAIKTLCLLSLAFGGLLWPIAWLWAYTRPVAYRMAYGTDKHEHYYEKMAERARAGELDATELEHLIAEIDYIERSGNLTPQLRDLRAAISQAPPAPATAGGAPGAAGGAA